MGPELMEEFRKQAVRFGAEVVFGDVISVALKQRPFTVVLGRDTYQCDALIVATGASAKLLGLESETRLMGHGVSACATCDGFFFKGKEVAVVGGGDTAMEEATFLTKFATKVTIIHRREEFRASKIMLERARMNAKIAWKLNSTVTEIHGKSGKGVEALTLRDNQTNALSPFPTQGLFVAIGHEPNTKIFRGKLEMNDVGYIKIKHPSTQTSAEGVFAA